VAIGLASGLLVALLATNALRAVLFGVGPRDPLAFASATMMLLVSASAAAVLAGRRAARIAPTEALRSP
jgi:ABC-type lipoprotein release transport system permease subunit